MVLKSDSAGFLRPRIDLFREKATYAFEQWPRGQKSSVFQFREESPVRLSSAGRPMLPSIKRVFSTPKCGRGFLSCTYRITLWMASAMGSEERFAVASTGDMCSFEAVASRALEDGFSCFEAVRDEAVEVGNIAEVVLVPARGLDLA